MKLILLNKATNKVKQLHSVNFLIEIESLFVEIIKHIAFISLQFTQFSPILALFPPHLASESLDPFSFFCHCSSLFVFTCSTLCTLLIIWIMPYLIPFSMATLIISAKMLSNTARLPLRTNRFLN